MLFERPKAGHKSVVLHVELRNQPNPKLGEFVELAHSADIRVIDTLQARRDAPNPNTFVGSGKVDEVGAALRNAGADLLLINHELSAGQQRIPSGARLPGDHANRLILIFADRARSHEGQLQVELAQLKHAQTRLVRGWTHLDRRKAVLVCAARACRSNRSAHAQWRLKAVEKNFARSISARAGAWSLRRGTPMAG